MNVGDKVAVKEGKYPQLCYQVAGTVVAVTDDYVGVYLDTDFWPNFTWLEKDDIEPYSIMIQRLSDAIKSAS